MEEKDRAVFSFLGLCMRSGKLVSGEFKSKKAVLEKKAQLVIVSTEASEGTKKLFRDKCSYYKVPLYYFGTKEELGHSIGRMERASVAVLDEGFAAGLMKRLKDRAECCGGSEYGES